MVWAMSISSSRRRDLAAGREDHAQRLAARGERSRRVVQQVQPGAVEVADAVDVEHEAAIAGAGRVRERAAELGGADDVDLALAAARP